MAFRNGNKDAVSLATFERQLKWRKANNLCFHCGKRPCVCKKSKPRK